MKQSDSFPLVSAPRRRGWLDVLLMRPLGGSPHSALLITRRGRLVNMIPAGGSRVLSDYLDLPCDIIEVDGRERHLPLDLLLESSDAGHFFRAALQLAYQVQLPERVALEVDDPLGELTLAIQAALSSTARVLTLDQTPVLKASIDELFQRGTPLVVRAQALGLSLKRVDVKVEPASEDRAFLEELQALQREHALSWRFFAESLDPRVTFDVQVGGFFRSRVRITQSARLDEVEFALREAIERVVRRVAVEYVPQEFRDAARAMGAALRESPVLQAELATIQVDLLRPAVEIQPARPMLADTMRARLALPAPAPYADAPEGETDWMLPPLPLPEVAAPQPVAPPPPAPRAIVTPAPQITAEPSANDSLWADEDVGAEEDLDLAADSARGDRPMPEWLVDRAIFGAIQPDPDSEEHIPVWLRGWDGQSPEPTDPMLSRAPDEETLAQGAADEIAEAPNEPPGLWMSLGDAAAPEPVEPWDPANNTATEGAGPSWPLASEEAQQGNRWLESDAEDDPQAPAWLQPDEGGADLPPWLSEQDAESDGLASPWLSADALPPEEAPPPQALVPYAESAARSALDLTAQVGRWIALLRSDGDEEFERLATVIVEQPDRLPTLLSGLIRDPQVLAGADDPSLQRALADELALDVRPAVPPPWLRDEPPSGPPTMQARADLPEWMTLKKQS